MSQIALYISCGRSAGGEGCPAASPVAVETWLHRSEVTLADDVAPVLETAPTGALVADAGTVSGRAHVSLLATDRGGGLTRAHVEVDGRIVATQALGSAPCQEPYTARVPCPQRAATTIPVETASLPDGRHVVRVLVDDAAGNRTGSAPTPLVTVNAQPDPSCTLEPTVSGPLSLSAALVREKGTSKSKHKRKSRKHRRSKSRRRARARARRASRARTTTRLTAPRPSLKVNYASRKRVTLVGRLARPDGSAVGSAPVCIVARTDGSDGIPQPLARLTTAPDGTFATRVPRGPSRELWAIHRTGAGAIVARAVLNVVPRVTIRPSRRHLRNGQVLTIRGSVSGGPIPRRGVIVKAEAWRGTRWQAFGTTRARGEDGRFKIRYRFTGTRGRQRYTLRVQVAAQAAYPYVSGRSKRIHVYVRG